MARDLSDSTPIRSRADLVGWLESGCKPEAQHRLGTEHEKIPFRLAGHGPVPYEGPDGIRALLEGMAAETGWSPIIEDDHPIGLFDPAGGGAISLEPGGQFELSGAPLTTLHETKAELAAHLAAAKRVGERLGIGFLTLGMSPVWTRAETPVMPKKRYRIMTNYMPKVGKLGLDMMYRTCTTQVNLDFASEADMVRKLRIGLALQPVIVALFANSPFTDGRPNGYRTYRAEIWRDTDPDRTGLLPFAFEDGMGFERYVDYALDVPMYFVKRGDTYHDVAGASFRDLLAGRLAALPGETATISDWANHLSTLFPEVRLKRYMEMRGADVGTPEKIIALPAVWVGLLYDASARDAAWDLAKSWTRDDREKLRADAPRLGLDAVVRGRSLRDVARDVVAIAERGLSVRARAGNGAADETASLAPLRHIVESGATDADRLLARHAGAWAGDLDRVFDEIRF